MRKASIVLAVLATTLAGGAPLAQAQESSASQAQASSAQQAQAKEQKGPTLGGHIGFVLPLVTHSGGQTTSLGDAPAVGFPTGITVKGSGPMAFDFEFVPQYNATGHGKLLSPFIPVLYMASDTAGRWDYARHSS